jgi:serine/threonine-protein kinase RsbW
MARTVNAVTLKVPPAAGYLAVLRTAVGAFAARDQFTLDQVDDLRMAVEETAVQLLRHASGEVIVMDVSSTDSGIRVQLHTTVTGGPVFDEASFSWTILRALTDEVHSDTIGSRATVVLDKHRIIVEQQPEAVG